jgi:RNase P/RNase MRP subunit POP5
MLKRRSKRRYISIFYEDVSTFSAKTIKKRYCDLFGSIGVEKAAIRMVRSNANRAIIKCKLEQLDNVLVAITFTYPSLLVLDVSGSIKRIELRKRELDEANKLTTL